MRMKERVVPSQFIESVSTWRSRVLVTGNEESKLFVAGLPDSISEEVLKQLFEATGGTVVNVSLPKDRATGRPRGFGFVTLSTPAEAQTARDALDGSMQAGKSISVRPFQAEPPRRDGPGGGPGSGPPRAFGGPRGPGGPRGGGGPSIYVGNLPYDATQQEIEALINGASSGSVVAVKLPSDPDGRKRGFGFVEVASVDAANAAIEALKNAELRGRRLVINLAKPPGERPPRPAGAGFGGGGGGGFGGGGGGFGGPPSNFGPPAQGRKTFDDRRRKQHSGGGDDGPRKPRFGGADDRGGGGRGGRGGRHEDDWTDDE